MTEKFNKSQQFKSVKTLTKSNQLDKAIAQLELLLNEYPRFVTGWMELGRIYRKQRKRKKALRSFKEAYSLSPSHALAGVEVAVELKSARRITAAKKILEDVFRAQPDNMLAAHHLGVLHRENNDPDQAVKFFQQALSISPSYVSSHFQLALTLQKIGDKEAAETEFKAVLEHKPNHLQALLHLGDLRRNCHDVESALSYYKRACQIQKKHVSPNLRLVSLLRQQQQLHSAEQLIDEILKNHPSEFRAYVELGLLYRQKGDRQEAIDYFKKAQQLAKQPKQKLEAQLFVIEEHRAFGQVDEALQLTSDTLQQHPNNNRAKLIKATLLQKKFDLQAAEDLYKSVIEEDPSHINAHVELAKILDKTDRKESAVQLLEDLYQRGNRKLQLLIQLGRLADSEDNYTATYYWYSIAQKCHPNDALPHRAKANTLYKYGKMTRAIASASNACRRFSDSPQILLCLAQLQLKFGHPEESEQTLQTCIDQFPYHIPSRLLLSRLSLLQGKFDLATKLLDEASDQQVKWQQQIQRLRGDIALWQYDLNRARKYFQESVHLAVEMRSTPPYERLALSQILAGKVGEAHTQLVSASENIESQQTRGTYRIPAKGHIATLINQFRNNPVLMQQLTDLQVETEDERMLSLAKLVEEEPAYFGASMLLCKELRQQGIFSTIRKTFSERSNSNSRIPRRIVQYWDSPTPPDYIVEVGNSWKTYNSGYEYKRFSYDSAFEFLQESYNGTIVEAFQLCEHPATQADFFRLAYLAKKGGFYVDVDDRCRASIDDLANFQTELILYQEENACVGNNFIGCVAKQSVIEAALYQAADNLKCYNNDGPWIKTGPGLLTTVLCETLSPYLSAGVPYEEWPAISILPQEELRKYSWWSVQLPYKHTKRSWQKVLYQG